MLLKIENMIHAVVEGYGIPIKANKICCPFHKERSASLHLYSKDYYCYGCGAGGNVINFIREYEKTVNDVDVGFEDVVKSLCDAFNLTKEELMQELESDKSEAEDENKAMDIEEVKKFIVEIGYKSNNYRGIRDDVNQFFGHLTKLDESGTVIARYYPETNRSGKVTGYKCRNHPKDFSYGKIGITGATSQLSGQVKFKSPSKYILITGGEEDKAAAYQMLLDGQKPGFGGIPVVSSTVGELTAAKQIQAQYEFFDLFDIIVVGMDNDEAGQKATEAICQILPKDKVRVAKWSGKDPNQMLLSGKQNQFVRDFYNAREIVNSGVSRSTDAEEGLEEFLTAEKITLPNQLHKLQTAMRGGIRSTGAIVNIIGDTSIGKSFLSDTLIYHWLFNSPLVPTIVSLERTKEELVIDLLSIHLKKNLLWFSDGHDAVDYLNKPEVRKLKQELLTKPNGQPRFYVIDEREGDIDILKSQIEKSAKMNESKLIVVDPLTDFLRSLGTEVQDEFLMWEKLQKKNGIVFINVLHTRKPPTDKDGKVRKVTEYDALGSSTFVQSADINIVLNRDKMASDPVVRNTTEVDMPKCRGGITGHVCNLYYDAETRQQYDKEDYFNGGKGEDVNYDDEIPMDLLSEYEGMNLPAEDAPGDDNTYF